MRQLNSRGSLWGVGFFAMGLALSSFACPPLPVLLYPADEVYRRQGLEIPDLPSDAVAWMKGEALSKADYQEWLYQKVGFEPDLRKDFIVNQYLKRHLQANGVDTARQREIVAANFLLYSERGLYSSCEAWSSPGEGEPLDSTALPQRVSLLVENSYLKALYILESWEEIYGLGLDQFGVDRQLFEIEGDDEEVLQIIKLNNAMEMLDVFSSRISTHIEGVALRDGDLNLPEDTEAFKEWVYAYHNTVYLLETYLGMILSYENAEKQNLQISEETIQSELKYRMENYKSILKSRHANLPASCIPLQVSPIYTDFILQEVRDDLYKSKAYRLDHPLKPHEIQLRFYEQYGFEGQRCEVREIFKWVRTRRTREPVPGSEAYIAGEEARIRSELNGLRQSILREGPESFFTAAMVENDVVLRQRLAGRVDVNSVYGAEVAQALSSLTLNEISPVMHVSPYSLELFSLVEVRGTNRVYSCISKSLPVGNIDIETYQNECERARDELEQLQLRVEQGASFETLAKEHSDRFDRNHGDVSETYQFQHGFAVAKEINAIPEGGFKIVELKQGLHLFQVLSRVTTPYSEEIQEQIRQQHSDEMAKQSERYLVAKKLLYAVNPYFK